jgi:hypothetical protein
VFKTGRNGELRLAPLIGLIEARVAKLGWWERMLLERVTSRARRLARCTVSFGRGEQGGKERHFATFSPYPFSTRLIAAANS